MATHDYVIDNSTGANVRSDINNALAAIVSNNSSSSQPTTRYAYMWWADTTTGILKIRNSANDGWVELLQLDGTLTLEDGSAGTPALAFRDDLNTGIFSSAANHVNFATNGVERIDIGTDDIVVNNGGADLDFRIEGDTDANLFKVDAGNDRIGIGLSSPTSKLHTKVTSADNRLTLETATSGNPEIMFNAAGAGGHVIGFDRGNTALTFTVAGGSERMRIDSTGRVLIGQTSSDDGTSMLQVKRANNSTIRVASSDATATNFAAIDFAPANSTQGAAIICVADGTFSGSSNQSAHLRFITRNSGTDAEKMRIDSAGRLLLGTTSGSHTLTVSGDIATSGDILLTVDDEKIQLGASQDFLLFHNGGANYVYGVGNHPMLFFSNNVERMRLHGNTHQLQIGGSTLINSDPYLTLGQSANSQGNVLHVANNGSNDLKQSFLAAGKTSRAIGVDVSADTFNIFRDNSDIDFLITNSGNIGMVTSGTYTALAQVTIQHDGSRFGMCIHNTNGGGGVQTCMRIRRNDTDVGSITTSGTNTQFNTSSDYRLKENQTAITDGIARIKQLLPKRFNWISDETNTMQDGFFAHEVSNVVPEAITGVKDEVASEDEDNNNIKKGDPIYQQIDQSKLVPLLVAAVQELITKVETLEAA